MVNYRFAYLFGCIIFGVIWLFIYLERKDLRKEQIFMSLFVAVFGLTEPLFFNEYWKPQFLFTFPGINIGIESILLCFFYGGIASTLYEFTFNNVLKKKVNENQKTRMLEVAFAIMTAIAMLLLLWSALKINIIYASALAVGTGGMVFVFFRRDLFDSAVIGGLIMAAIALIVLSFLGMMFKGIFDSWWRLDLLSGIRILSVPIEEIIWHFYLGFAAAPMYEVWKGYGDYKKSLL